MTDGALREILGTGVVGAIAILALAALVKVHRDLLAEKQARIDDANKFNQMSLTLQREVIAAVDKIEGLVQLVREQFEALKEERRNYRGGAR